MPPKQALKVLRQPKPAAVASEEDEPKSPVPQSPSIKSKPFVKSYPASSVGLYHTLIGSGGFLGALVLACYHHYYQVVKNEFFGYPQEWFPSISATIGDWYPERNFFQAAIAFCLLLRLSLIFLNRIVIEAGLHKHKIDKFGLNKILFWIGILRHICFAGWVYVTSNDSHPIHEGTMVAYIVFTILYHLLAIYLFAKSGRNTVLKLLFKSIFAAGFAFDLFPMIYFFLLHKDNTPGAYTHYALFEWGLVFFDIGFDAFSMSDYSSLTIQITDSHGETVGEHEKNRKYFEDKNNKFTPNLFQVIIRYVSDIYLAYVSWSLLTSLGVCIWFFPLFDMEISGYEIALLGSCLSFLNGIGAVRNFFQKYRALAILLSLIGVASYLVPNPSQRLGVIGIGVAFDVILVTALWWDPQRKDQALITHLFGLVLFLIVKVLFITNNPIWPTMNHTNGGLNVEGIIAALIALAEVSVRTEEKTPFIRSPPRGHFLFSAVGFGALLFLTQTLFTDYSVVSNWVVTGYPDHGPLPYPWGLLVVASIILGITLSTSVWVVNPLWWLFGLVGSILLYNAPTYLGFLGGLMLAVYLFSVWPVVVNSIVGHPPGRTLFVASLVYIAGLLTTVWVVAYPFVPGGEYLRERSHFFLYPAMALVFLGTYGGSPLLSDANPNFKSKISTRIKVTAFILLGLLGGAGYVRSLRPKPAEIPVLIDQPKPLTVAVWTIHFGYDEQMWFSHRRMVDVLKKTQADIYSLLETDTTRVFMGNRDVIQWMADDMNMYYDFGPSTRNHTWGCAIISRFPILWSEHILLPSPQGELACAIHATLDVYGSPVDFLISHNGNEEHEIDRRLQTEVLGSIMKKATHPIIYAGYVTTSPDSDNYHLLVTKADSKDIDPTDNDRWCQYIVYKGLEKVAYGRITHGGITDTEIQVAKFLVGTGRDNEEEVAEESIKEGLRLPAVFKGEGVNGHHYHVFDRPKYFGRKGN